MNEKAPYPGGIFPPKAPPGGVSRWGRFVGFDGGNPWREAENPGNARQRGTGAGELVLDRKRERGNWIRGRVIIRTGLNTFDKYAKRCNFWLTSER